MCRIIVNVERVLEMSTHTPADAMFPCIPLNPLLSFQRVRRFYIINDVLDSKNTPTLSLPLHSFSTAVPLRIIL